MITTILFLGNPGKQYEKTRHNAGYLLRAAIENNHGPFSWASKGECRYTKVQLSSKSFLLIEPTVFMNTIGQPVQRILSFFQIPIEQVLVVHDDLETAFGSVHFKIGGGTGGHNGLKSLEQHCGKHFNRLKIGIGRPPRGDVSAFVLGRFTPNEEIVLPIILDGCIRLIELLAQDKSLDTKPYIYVTD